MDGLKSLDLFSGIGGFALAAERAGIEIATFCEIDKFPQSVLKYRYPDIPVIDDVRKLTKETFKSATGLDYIDIVCGGSPCQNLSVAGITIAAVSAIYAIFKWRKILTFAKIAILSITFAASICLCLYLAGLALQPKFISKHSDHITLAPNKPIDKRIAVIADKDTFGKYFGKILRKAYAKATPETVLDIYCEIPENAEVYDKFIVTGKFTQTFQPPTSTKVVYINPIGNPPPPCDLTNATIYLPRFDIYNQNTKWINAAKKAKITHSFIETSSNQIPETTLQSEFSDR